MLYDYVMWPRYTHLHFSTQIKNVLKSQRSGIQVTRVGPNLTRPLTSKTRAGGDDRGGTPTSALVTDPSTSGGTGRAARSPHDQLLGNLRIVKNSRISL